jgi:hypothetical protein
MQKEIFKCQKCDKKYSTLSHLSRHAGTIHGNKKEYYDRYLKKEKEGICFECGKPTEYTNKWQNAYKIYCSDKCKKQGVPKKVEKTTSKKYGVSNVNKLKRIRNRIKKTNKKKYGNSCPMQNIEIQKNIREQNLKNLGVELPFQSKKIRIKGRKTMKEKYGVEYTYQSSELYEKCKTTMIKKYEMPFTLQSDKLFEQSFKTRILLKRFRDTNILYQGSYELDFLEKYFHRLNIQRASSIKYQLKNKERIYYPDFFLQDLNLIIEIKNKYLAKRDRLQIKAKERAVIFQGFKFIMILGKKYDEFEKLLSENNL